MSSQDDMATTNGVSGLPPPGKVSGVCVCVCLCVCVSVCVWVCCIEFCLFVCVYVCFVGVYVCMWISFECLSASMFSTSLCMCTASVCMHACIHFDLSLYDESTSRLGCWTFLGGHSSLSQMLLEPCWNYTDHLATYLWVWVEGEQWQTFSKNGHWNLRFLICLMKDNMDSPDKFMGQSEWWLLVAEATSQFTTP